MCCENCTATRRRSPATTRRWRLHQSLAIALYNRGVVLQDLARYDEALASYDRALSVKPDLAEALNNRGLVLIALTRYDEAIDSYNKAIEARPGFADALYNRGN